MKASNLRKLCCPVCKNDLILKSFGEEERLRFGQGTEGFDERVIKEGVLLCSNCKVWYPIFSYVPVMLVFETNFHRRFAKQNAERLREFSGYGMPSGRPNPGERSIQETFTDQWNSVQGDELSFLYSIEDLKSLNREVWLKWLKCSTESIRSVLNVGCGLGDESIALKGVMNEAEIFAIDLNFALLRSGERFKANPSIHPVIASMLCLPFRPASFDLVYSQGVIHRARSTFDALKSISSYARKGGHVFVWVYGLDDHLVYQGGVGFVARVAYMVEAMIRPVISRSPKFVRDVFFGITVPLIHPIIKWRVRHKESWKLKNTNHDLRNWLSPRYSNRHSYNEFLEWFEDLGFEVVDVQSPAAYKQLFQKRLGGVGVTGRSLKSSSGERLGFQVEEQRSNDSGRSEASVGVGIKM